MITRKFLFIYLFVFSFSLALPIHAEQAQLKHFVPGSYQQLLNSNADKPFVLTIWSTTCSSCLEKMALLNELQRSRPDINIIMLSTDDVSAADQIQTVLAKNELTNLENWVFAEENAQRLRYEIDPGWYGELPRTYFLNKNHERHGVSGALSHEDYDHIFKVILD